MEFFAGSETPYTPGDDVHFLYVRLNFWLAGPTLRPVVFERDGYSLSFSASLQPERHDFVLSYTLALPDGREFVSDSGSIAAGDVVELLDLEGEGVSLPFGSMSINAEYSPVVGGSLRVVAFDEGACGLAFVDSLGVLRFLGDGDDDLVIFGEYVDGAARFPFEPSPMAEPVSALRFSQQGAASFADGIFAIMPTLFLSGQSVHIAVEGVDVTGDGFPSIQLGSVSPVSIPAT